MIIDDEIDGAVLADRLSIRSLQAAFKELPSSNKLSASYAMSVSSGRGWDLWFNLSPKFPRTSAESDPEGPAANANQVTVVMTGSSNPEQPATQSVVISNSSCSRSIQLEPTPGSHSPHILHFSWWAKFGNWVEHSVLATARADNEVAIMDLAADFLPELIIKRSTYEAEMIHDQKKQEHLIILSHIDRMPINPSRPSPFGKVIEDQRETFDIASSVLRGVKENTIPDVEYSVDVRWCLSEALRFIVFFSEVGFSLHIVQFIENLIEPHLNHCERVELYRASMIWMLFEQKEHRDSYWKRSRNDENAKIYKSHSIELLAVFGEVCDKILQLDDDHLDVLSPLCSSFESDMICKEVSRVLGPLKSIRKNPLIGVYGLADDNFVFTKAAALFFHCMYNEVTETCSEQEIPTICQETRLTAVLSYLQNNEDIERAERLLWLLFLGIPYTMPGKESSSSALLYILIER